MNYLLAMSFGSNPLHSTSDLAISRVMAVSSVYPTRGDLPFLYSDNCSLIFPLTYKQSPYEISHEYITL